LTTQLKGQKLFFEFIILLLGRTGKIGQLLRSLLAEIAVFCFISLTILTHTPLIQSPCRPKYSVLIIMKCLLFLQTAYLWIISSVSIKLRKVCVLFWQLTKKLTLLIKMRQQNRFRSLALKQAFIKVMNKLVFTFEPWRF